MIYSILADAVLSLHLAFILFVVFGALLVWYFPRLAWLHLPAALWGALIEFTSQVCPLTPLENHLRRLGGDAGYHGDFVAHYLIPFIYPESLTSKLQVGLGVGVVVINIAAYALMYRRRGRHEQQD